MNYKINYRIRKSGFFKGLVLFLACSCVLPLLAVLFYIIKAGITHINWDLLTNVDKPSDEAGGGILHALTGSILIIIVASLIAIPLGILCGIFLSETKKSRLTYWCGLCVDVLQGVPSMVIGIVAYIWLVKPIGAHQGSPGHPASSGFALLGQSGFAGSIALAIMMFPIIIRSTEETLKLLPDALREAGFALGMPFHRVILKIIVPCGISGILSGVLLSIARIAGETAPLLFTAFGNMYFTADMRQPMETLPHIIFKFAQSPYPNWQNIAWGASLVLLTWVLLLNISTKLITRKWKVQL